LIDVVSGYYDYVLFDLGSGLDPLCLRAIEKIDQLFLIGSAALPSVRRASQILRLWESLGYSSSIISLILNRINGRSFLERHEVEKVLGRSISHFLPDERKLLQESLLRGKQIIDLSPRSSFSKALFEWTAEISGKPLRGKSLWQRLGIK
jgi:pilus assembly protein CpaE